MTSEHRIVDNSAGGRFEILVGDQVAGYAEYRRTQHALAFTHTVVEPEFEGQGIGSALARGVLDAARERDTAVLPFCPFIRGYIQRHPAYLDLVPVQRRAEFALTPGDSTPDGPRG